jgi:hypothetical protein
VSNTPSSLAARRNLPSGVSYNSSDSGAGARRNRSTPENTFKNPLAKEAKKDAIQIQTFTEEALAQADITRDSSKGIFDIISNRYRHSAWSRFEMDRLVQEVPAPAEAPAPTPAQ